MSLMFHISLHVVIYQKVTLQKSTKEQKEKKKNGISNGKGGTMPVSSSYITKYK